MDEEVHPLSSSASMFDINVFEMLRIGIVEAALQKLAVVLWDEGNDDSDR